MELLVDHDAPAAEGLGVRGVESPGESFAKRNSPRSAVVLVRGPSGRAEDSTVTLAPASTASEGSRSVPRWIPVVTSPRRGAGGEAEEPESNKGFSGTSERHSGHDPPPWKR